MKNSEQFLVDLREIYRDEILDDQQAIENAVMTMGHYNTTDFLLGGKYTKSGKVEAFRFAFKDGEYHYLGKKEYRIEE